MVSLIGFVSDKCSFVVAFVDGLFIYGYISLRFDVHSLLRDVLLRLQVAEEFLFLSARRRAYIVTTFHSLLIIILFSQPP